MKVEPRIINTVFMRFVHAAPMCMQKPQSSDSDSNLIYKSVFAVLLQLVYAL